MQRLLFTRPIVRSSLITINHGGVVAGNTCAIVVSALSDGASVLAMTLRDFVTIVRI